MDPFWTFSLDPFRWKNRVLLTFAIGPYEPRFVTQEAAMNDGLAGLHERDVVRVECLGTRRGHLRNPGDTSPKLLQVEDIEQLRLDFGITLNDFATVLIGKDGTEKARWREPITPQSLFQTIDAMPMRQAEAKATPADGGK